MKNALIVIIGMVILIGALVFFSGKSEEKKNVRLMSMTSREVALLCTTDMATELHIHPTLTIVINGEKQVVPANIGITDTCMHSLHTHDASGTLHVEAPVQKDFTLADFFAVWEQPFDQTHILESVTDDTHEIVVTVNGATVDTFENTVLVDKDQIVISYQSR